MQIVLNIRDHFHPPEPEPPAGMWDDIGDSFALSSTQRIIGCILSFLMGAVCLALAVFFVPMIVFTPAKFAFFFTFGNVFLLAGTMFLVGPMRQFRSMFERSRLTATLLYVTSLIMTLVAALQFGSLVLVTLFTCLQVLAFVWYVLSYIPFARTVLKTVYNRGRSMLGFVFRRSS
eukprot:EG_transcript_31827